MIKTTTSVDALIAEGQYMFLIGNGPINILAGKLADALERQQAVVEAARNVAKDHEDFPAMRRLRRELARLDRKKGQA